MTVESAGILLFRKRGPRTEVLLAHPGGPFWKNRDAGAWSVPKGVLHKDEHPLVAARREFKEETGFDVDGDFDFLGRFRQPSGKLLTIYAVESDWDPGLLISNTFSIEWPPHSGKRQDFPEIDRAGWFDQSEANARITRGQRPALDQLYARS